MRLYLSGTGYWPELAAAQYPAVLCAYLPGKMEDDLRLILEDVRRAPLPYLHVMLDSGAFGAWNSGRVIEFDHWLGWAQEVTRQLSPRVASVVAVGLDAIATEQTPAGREVAAARSFDNWARARAAGVEVMPVWHKGERVAWLERYVAARVPWIGLGGMVGQGLPGVWSHLHAARRVLPATQRVHLFGVGVPHVLAQVPCYSADTTSWLAGVRFARWPDCWLNPTRRGLTFSHAQHWRARWHYRHAVSVAIAQYAQLEQDVTALWAGRGITWREEPDALANEPAAATT